MEWFDINQLECKYKYILFTIIVLLNLLNLINKINMLNQFNMEDSSQMARTQVQKNQFDRQSKLGRSISYMESEPPASKKSNIDFEASATDKLKPFINNSHLLSQSSDESDKEQQNLKSSKRLNIKSQDLDLDMEAVQKNLREIFGYYSQSYLQPTKKYETFDAVKNRYLKFQSFVLFLKDFHILKNIFPLTKIKILFKKYAKYGKHMDFQNFFAIVNAMPHENEAKDVINTVFNIGKYTKQLKTLDNQVHAELQKQTFFNYMKLFNPKQYRNNFSKIFQPFLCEQEAQLPKIKYQYRKFSTDELHKKAIPDIKNQNDKQKRKEFIVLKSKEKAVVEPSIFNQTKPMIVSWELFRSKSLGNIQKSFQKVRRKIIHQSQEDDLYLQKFRLNNDKKMMRNISQSPTKQGSSLNNIQKKIMQIQKMQDKKDQQILDRIDNTMKKRKLIM